jgi:hypothetical protein
MTRVFRVFTIALFASVAGASGAIAAPQILAVLETAEPVPLTCVNGVCEAEFSTMCLQRGRAMPRPGTAYAPADPRNIVLVIRRADGSTARIAGHRRLGFSVPRTYVSVTATIDAAALAELGAVSAAVEIGPLASLVPVPTPGDTSPITAEEVARVTGVYRMAAERAVRRQRETIGAARITRRLANALVSNPTPTNAERKDLWDRIATATPAGTGVQKARDVFDTCHDYAEALGEEGFRGCLQYRHDYLMQRINDIYWNRNDAGS